MANQVNVFSPETKEIIDKLVLSNRDILSLRAALALSLSTTWKPINDPKHISKANLWIIKKEYQKKQELLLTEPELSNEVNDFVNKTRELTKEIITWITTDKRSEEIIRSLIIEYNNEHNAHNYKEAYQLLISFLEDNWCTKLNAIKFANNHFSFENLDTTEPLSLFTWFVSEDILEIFFESWLTITERILFFIDNLKQAKKKYWFNIWDINPNFTSSTIFDIFFPTIYNGNIHKNPTLSRFAITLSKHKNPLKVSKNSIIFNKSSQENQQNILNATIPIHKNIKDIIKLFIEELLLLNETFSLEEILNNIINYNKNNDWEESESNYIFRIIIKKFIDSWEKEIILNILQNIINENKIKTNDINNYLKLEEKNLIVWKIIWICLEEYNLFYNRLNIKKAWIDLKILINQKWKNLKWLLQNILENIYKNKENWFLIIKGKLNNKEVQIKTEFNFNNLTTFAETLFKVIDNINKTEWKKWNLEIINILFTNNIKTEEEKITKPKKRKWKRNWTFWSNQDMSALIKKRSKEKKLNEINNQIRETNLLIEKIPVIIILNNENQIIEARKALNNAIDSWINELNFNISKLEKAEKTIIELKIENNLYIILDFLINLLEINDIINIIKHSYNWEEIDNFISQNDLDRDIYDKIYDLFIIIWKYKKLWKKFSELLELTLKIQQKKLTIFISNSTLTDDQIKRSLLLYIEESTEKLEENNSRWQTPIIKIFSNNGTENDFIIPKWLKLFEFIDFIYNFITNLTKQPWEKNGKIIDLLPLISSIEINFRND